MHCATAIAALLQIGTAYAGVKLPDEPADKSTPVQQRLSFKAPNAVSVAWNTYKKMKPCVQFGTARKDLSKTVCSTESVTFPSSRTWANLVVLKGLTPATTYYYRIGSTNSTTEFFKTAREAGDKTPFTMNTLADMGLYGKDGYTVTKRSMIPKIEPALNHTTIGRLATTIDDFEFVIHPGDLAYADDWIEDPTNYLNSKDAYTAIVERFYTQLAPISARKPYMVSPGNHEADCTEVAYFKGVCPEGQYNFSDYTNRFEGMLPTTFHVKSASADAVSAGKKAQQLARPPFWYSFDYGMVHIVMINTETDFPNAPDAPGGSANLDSGPFGAPKQQLRFLEADLSSVDRRVTPWVIVSGHRPWYTNGGTSSPCKPCQAAFEGILYKYGVDLAAFGHVHNLQRFAPIYKNKVDPAGMKNPKAPMYTVIGGAGNIEGHSPITPVTTGNVFAYNTDFGFGSLTFYNSTNLGINFYSSKTGEKLDSSVLYKKHDVPFVRQVDSAGSSFTCQSGDCGEF